MKFIQNCSGTLVLFCVLLTNKLKLTESVDPVQDILPVISGVAGLLGPMGQTVAQGLEVFKMINNVLHKDDNVRPALTKSDFLEKATEITDSIKVLTAHSIESNKQVVHLLESFPMHENMRVDLDSLTDSCNTNLGVILNPKNNGVAKKAVMNAMLDYYSVIRQTLREFVTKYIKPKGLVAATGETKLFFDLILRREQSAADSDDDCYTESTHNKLFKSYMYILKTLTNSYLMVISAHTAQYQKEIQDADVNEAIETQRISLNLLEQYKNDMKTLMDKTTWALKKASREIRNCETFDLIQGETFERISFAYLIPKLKDWSYDPDAYFSIYTGPKYSCYTREQDVKYNNYEILDGGECKDGGLKRPASLEVFVNSTNSDWPYEFALNKPTLGAVSVLGHNDKGSGGLTKREFLQSTTCYSVFCPAFKKNAVAISTKIVSAKPGNVITGVRFKVKNNVIYIQIKEGKFVDALTVDPQTVNWTEISESDEVLYLNSKARKVELGDAELQENEYLTSIKLNLKTEEIIGVNVGGSSNPNWAASVPKESSHLYKSNDLSLSGCDNPEHFSANVKNSISKSPVPQLVSFQPSDLTKDMGISTIPYIDTRGVESDPPSPLSGIGIYHQAVKGSGGFLSLKIMSLDLSRFVDYNLIQKLIDNKDLGLVQ